MIKKGFMICLAAGLIVVQPIQADAAQISLALAGGITTSLDESSASDNEIGRASCRERVSSAV